MKLLVLGGTSEASEIVRGLAGMPGIDAMLSLAGRTRSPAAAPVPARSGGFGGIDGLVAYLRAARVDVLIDATHPFAQQMSRHAEAAAERLGLPRLAVIRPAWARAPGDRWTEVADMSAAAMALGTMPRRVFLTVGRQELAPFVAVPQHDYLIRSVDPPAAWLLPPRARCIAARGPFAAAAERRLLADAAIEVLVTKNSGGSATAGKLAAARALGLAVVMVRRPEAPPGPVVETAAQALEWLRHQAGTAAARGV